MPFNIWKDIVSLQTDKGPFECCPGIEEAVLLWDLQNVNILQDKIFYLRALNHWYHVTKWHCVRLIASHRPEEFLQPLIPSVVLNSETIYKVSSQWSYMCTRISNLQQLVVKIAYIAVTYWWQSQPSHVHLITPENKYISASKCHSFVKVNKNLKLYCASTKK